jgi:hypothetical protein
MQVRTQALTNRIAMALALGIVLTVAIALTGGRGAGASVSTQLQNAQDAKANCQLLAANTAAGTAQHNRAVNCTNDQQKIIDLLTVPSPSPSPSPTVTSSPSPSPTTPSPSPTPTPTPSPTPTGQLGCAAHPGACGFPDASTAGAHGTLATYGGSLNFTTPGAVVSNVAIAGCPRIRATNVMFSNVRIVCSDPGYVVDNGEARGGNDPYDVGTTVMDHVTVVCASAMHGGTAFGEARMSVRWADISGCENGGDADRDFEISQSYIHDMFLGDSVAPDPHTDGIQVWPHAANIVYDHNTVLMQGANASFTAGGGSPLAQLTVTNNLLIGGNFEVYWSSNAGTLANNRFGDKGPGNGKQGISPFGYCSDCNTASGNVLDSTGQPLSLADLNG